MRFTPTESCRIKKARVYFSLEEGTAKECRVQVHDNSGGKPGGVRTYEDCMPQSGWNEIIFSSPITFDTNFWITANKVDYPVCINADGSLNYPDRNAWGRGSSWSVPPSDLEGDLMIRAVISTATITVTQPNDPESWAVGSSHDITWTSGGVSGNVKIELYKGGSEDSDIATNIANNGLYSWAIPVSQSPGTDYKVRITSVGTPSIWDESNNNFSITAPSITITQPNDPESWAVGSSHDITWTSDGVSGNVKIELYKGGSLNSTIASNVTNNGSYSWVIPASQTLGTDYKVRITSVGTPSIWDESNSNFGITAPSITITQPNDPESWAAGSSHNITWTSGGVSGNVKIELYKGGSLNSTIVSNTSNNGSYSWVIPASQTLGTDYKVRITSVNDPSIWDKSDSNFSIVELSTTVIRPNGVGDETNLSKNGSGGSNYDRVDDVTPDDATYVYTNLSDFRRDLYNLSDLAGSGTIDNIEVFARVKVEPPEGRIKICIKTGGTVYKNAEISDITTSYVNYSNIWATNPKTGNAWTLAEINALQAGVSLKRFSSGPGSPSDLIYCTQVYVEVNVGGAAPTMTVADPNGSESWATGSSHDITWTSSGVSGNVKIELYKGDSLNSTIASNVTNNGSYTWSIPASQTPGTDYKVRITSIDDPSIWDVSDSVFSIIEVSTEEEVTPLPKVYGLSQAHPNPAIQTVVIRYACPCASKVSLRIYDMGSRLVKTLIDEENEPGYHSVVWDMRDNAGKRLSSGIYFYRLETPGFTATRKLIIMR